MAAFEFDTIAEISDGLLLQTARIPQSPACSYLQAICGARSVCNRPASVQSELPGFQGKTNRAKAKKYFSVVGGDRENVF